jgi:probable rRNA maturation factor
MAFALQSTLRSRTPVSKKTGVVWSSIAAHVLPRTYDLSVVFIGDARMHRLNKLYRGKDKPTNVLAFPVSSTMGEIYIDIPYACRESQRYGHAPEQHLSYLFIHGLLHLKGLDHGTKMERLEKQLLKKFVR